MDEMAASEGYGMKGQPAASLSVLLLAPLLLRPMLGGLRRLCRLRHVRRRRRRLQPRQQRFVAKVLCT